jgi:S-adenosylmethionine:tRNA ribosyltransferase-isomerase
MMKTSDFNFDLPQELIAQDPLEDRSSSRLMVLNKESGEITHRIFHDIAKQNIFNRETVWSLTIQKLSRHD